MLFTAAAFSRPEPHILLFKRPLGTDPVSGKVDPLLEKEAKKAYQEELAGKHSSDRPHSLATLRARAE